MNQTTQKGITISTEELAELQVLGQKLTHDNTHNPHNLKTGDHASKKHGHGMQFHELRPYQIGDDIRHIHWQATARTGKPYSKLYTQDHEQPLCLWLDLNPCMYFGTRQHFKSVLALKIAATLAWSGYYQHERVASLIVSPNQETFHPPHKKLTAVLTLLDDLAQASALPAINKTMSDNPFSSLLPHWQRLPHGSLLYILTDGYGGINRWQDTLLQTSARVDVRFIHISDPLEWQFSKAQLYPVRTNNQTMLINMLARKTRANYAERFKQHTEQLSDSVTQSGAQWLPITTADDWQQQLLNWRL